MSFVYHGKLKGFRRQGKEIKFVLMIIIKLVMQKNKLESLEAWKPVKKLSQ